MKKVSNIIIKKLIGGVTLTILSQSVGMGLGLILTIILARVLAPDDIGVIAFVMAISGLLLTIGDLGISRAVQKYIQETEENKRQIIIAGSFIIKLMACSVLGILVLLIDGYFSILKGYGLFVALITIFSVFRLTIMIFNAKLEFKKAAFTKSLIAVVYFIGALIALTLKRGVYGVLIAQALSPAIIGIPIILIYFRPQLFNFKSEFKIIFNLMKFGLLAMVLSLFTIVFSQSDIIMITYLLDGYSTGLYRIAGVFASIPVMLSGFIMLPLFPIISKYMDEKNEQEMMMAHNTIVKILFVICLPILAIGLIFSSEIITIFFGVKYTSSIAPFRLLLIMNSLQALMVSFFAIIYIKNKISVLIGIATAVTFLNIAGNLILIPRLGINGAAITSLTTQIFGSILLLRYFAKAYNYRYRSLLKINK